MTLRALITGASGFAGTHLANHLRANGWEVVCSDRAGENCIPCDFSVTAEVDALVDVSGELSHVFHLAARTFVPDASANPAGAFDVNLLGTVRLLSRLARMPSPPRVLFVGSSEAYGPPLENPVTETHPLNPQNPYAISKAAADEYAAWVGRAGAMEVIRMRPFNHSGPGQSPQFALSSFTQQIAEIEAGKRDPVMRVGNLEGRRDFSHVDDVVAAYEAAALRGAPGEAYNVCSGRAIAIGDMLQGLLARSRARIDVDVDPDRWRPLDIPEIRGSHEKLTQATGWEQRRETDDLLNDLLTFWRATVK